MITQTARDVSQINTDIKTPPTMDDKWAFDYRFYHHLVSLNSYTEEQADSIDDINGLADDLNLLRSEINSTETDINSDRDTAVAKASEAETSRDNAHAWATTAEDEEVSGGEYSAYHYAQKAYDEAQGGTYGNVYTAKVNEMNKAQRPAAKSVTFASSITIDLTSSNDFEITLTGNTTISFSNLPSAGYCQEGVIRLIQDSTGGRSVTWDSSIKIVDDESDINIGADTVTRFTYKTRGTTVILIRAAGE